MIIDVETVTLKRCHVDHCQVCGMSFGQIELVFFVPLDNDLVCRQCADDAGTDVEPRIYVRGRRTQSFEIEERVNK